MASTLAQLRTRARIRADAVGNNFFTDDEINTYINTGLGELHDVLVLKFEDYYVSSKSFDLVSDQSNYTFASMTLTDFYKCLGVDVSANSETMRVRRFSFQGRNSFSSDVAIRGRGDYSDLQYQIRGDSVELIPKPSSAGTMTLWYVPSFTPLASDSDTVSTSIMSNWEEYAVLLAVLKMKEKEELSITAIEKELASTYSRIESAATNRDAGEPGGIIDDMAGVEIGLIGGY